MSDEALNVYETQLDWQLSTEGHFTSQAFFDPSGVNIELWGVFDSFTENKKEDGGHGFQKNVIHCFTLSRNSTLPDFNASENKQLAVTGYRTYKINTKSKNENGAVVLWLS